MSRRRAAILLLISGMVLLSGCAERMRNGNLEKVAKDWCLMIRASQVVPVYPLTDDLQVGDVFLVQYTVDQQHRQYEEQGFLPMDNPVARLSPTGFADFYSNSFVGDDDNGSFPKLPRGWMKDANAWNCAPSASFPTYSFSVSAGGGFDLAVPVQSVPVGLSMIGFDGAQGTISIGQAKTYGVDIVSLYHDLLDWERENHSFLTNYGSADGKVNYIRVVSRVYFVNGITVSMVASRGGGGKVTAGQARNVNLPEVNMPTDINGTSTATEANSKALADAVNSPDDKKGTESALAGKTRLLPGATVEVIAASSRAVAMHETFKRPLAVGYLGFDLAIGPDGVLGPPIPTHAVLTTGSRPSLQEPADLAVMEYSRLSRDYYIAQKLAEAGDPKAKGICTNLDLLAAELVPEKYAVPIFGDNLDPHFEAGKPVGHGKPAFPDVTTYLSRLQDSLKALEENSSKPEMREKWLEPTRTEYMNREAVWRAHRADYLALNRYVSDYFSRR